MVSKTCEYAIRAMIFIAQKSKKESITGINEINEAAAMVSIYPNPANNHITIESTIFNKDVIIILYNI